MVLGGDIDSTKSMLYQLKSQCFVGSFRGGALRIRRVLFWLRYKGHREGCGPPKI